MSIPKATVDFETRSACNLRSSGTWRYSIDPTTQILCLAFRLPHWEPERVDLWHPAFPTLDLPETDYQGIPEFLDWIADGGLVEAHGVWFEYCVWNNILIPRYDWPKIRLEQWRCSAAKAAAHALPRGLEDAGEAQHLDILKDVLGSKMMKKLAKPRKSRKKEREAWEKAGVAAPSVLYHESQEWFQTLFAYCKQDILAEEAVSDCLVDLSPDETEMFLMDLRINVRGFKIDREAVDTALTLIKEEAVFLNGDMERLTGGIVKKTTQRDQIIEWLHLSENYYLPNTQAKTLDDALANHALRDTVRECLTLVRAGGRSSTAKFKAMKAWMDPADDRVRGGLLYHGATTGRWSGKGVQPHNFPKLLPLQVGQKDSTPEDIHILWEALKRADRAEIATRYKSVMEALSASLRGTVVAGEGRQLYVADFAAIEARVVLWLADDQDALEVFRQHLCIYCDMASAIYNFPVNKKQHPAERGVGKQAVLGLGYQMGWMKFQATCAKFGIIISDEFAQRVVNAYREKYWRVKQLWADANQAAVDALHADNEGIAVPCGHFSYELEGSFLFCNLPSGRRLAYPEPRLSMRTTPWGAKQMALSYMGFNSLNHQWQRQTGYGGMFVEHISQATARDLMGVGMLACEAHPYYDLVLTVHDELVAEAPMGKGSVKEFEALMAKVPEWAFGCPVEAEGWSGTRYRK